MGKKSVKENKNVYQLSREAVDLTREKAGEQMIFISSDRIEKIESEKSYPHPDEIMAMAKCYRAPGLCNYYCSHECPIGQRYVPEVKVKELSQIVLEMLVSFNALEQQKNRLLEITVDGSLSEDEYKDFAEIRKRLNNISTSVSALQLWLDKMIADGKIDEDLFMKYMKQE